jgi:hypothetical protein
MPAITEMLHALSAREQTDVIGKILLAHAKEIEFLYSLHGRRTNVEFLTSQLLKERAAS